MDPNRNKKILCEMHATGFISEKEFIEKLKQTEKSEGTIAKDENPDEKTHRFLQKVFGR